MFLIIFWSAQILFSSDGRAFNINEARIPFSLDDSRPDALEITVQVYISSFTASQQLWVFAFLRCVFWPGGIAFSCIDDIVAI